MESKTFDVKPRSNFLIEEQLLYNIWQELKELNENLKGTNETEKVDEYTCNICKTVHKSKGDLLNCYKKHKGEGGKK